MVFSFTRIVGVALATVLTAGTVGAQTLRPYALATAARGAKQQTLTVDASIVLPKGAPNFRVEVPKPDGAMTTLDLRETSVMAAGMQARYPAIRTFRGVDVATGYAAAVTQTPQGINVYVVGAGGSWQVVADGPGRAVVSYVRDGDDLAAAAPLSCGYTAEMHAALEASYDKGDAKAKAAAAKPQARVTKRRYVLALASTGEFSQRYGGTKASVSAVFAEAVNILNAITLPEVAVEFELHPDNDTLVYLDPGTDPYIAPTNGPELLKDNVAAINSRIPVESYDIGHVFTNGCKDNIGGIAGGRACQTDTKARGVTCHYAGLRRIVEEVMAHEFAHQFSVSHSWNNCPTADGQRAGITAFEPGSGSTIMSYQGACGSANNVSERGDPTYYHVASVQQFQAYLASPLGSSCAEAVAVANDEPVVSAPGIDGLTIPRETPFVLRGSATDADGDAHLDTWEQYDLGAAVDLCEQREDTPLFRSLPPSAGGNVRYFPELDLVLGGRTSCEQQLPRFGRDLTFRLTARDRRSAGGGTAWQQVGMRVDGTAGPFRVTSQATAAVEYVTGDFINVTWDVAQTNAGAIGVQQVNILLSTDGGLTFPTVLAAATANDGAEGVTLPMTEATNARIKVEPVGNVFYAVSAATFRIISPTAPGFSFAPSASQLLLCGADTTSVELFTGSILGFGGDVTLRIDADLPAGARAELTRTTLRPGEATRLELDFTDLTESAVLEIDIVATADGAEAITRRLTVDRVRTDFDDLELRGPENGESGLSLEPTFAFTPPRNADEYTVEVNPDPSFGFGTFEINDPDPDGDQLGFLLEPNTVYFWRVVPKNRCGTFYDVPVNAFQTYAADCRTFKNESSVAIPANSTVPVVIPVVVNESGPANDINVPLVDIRFGAGVNNLLIYLASPDGTEVRLYNRRCDGTILRTGYDDESPLDHACPMDNGQVRQPNRALSAFDGKDINGEWRLRLEILSASPAPGEFRAFNLEFCANITSQAPTFRSTLVGVPQGGFQFLLPDQLTASDQDNASADLMYIVVDTPSRGHLELNGQRLETGSRFTQAQVEAAALTYVDDQNTPGRDSMRIVLSDNAGNLVATPRVDFEIDARYSTGIAEAPTVAMSLAPNPAGRWSRLRFAAPSAGGQVTILDAQGRVIHREHVAAGQSEVDIDAAAYPAGIYLVDYRGAEGARTLRLVRQ